MHPEQIKHIWENNGAYTVRAKAKDVNGYESEWMELKVNVGLTRTRTLLLESFLNRFPIIKSLVELLINRPLTI